MAKKRAAHEDFSRVEAPAKGSSDRTLGLVFAAVFAIIGCVPLLDGGEARLWSLAISVAFAIVALIRPTLLKQLNKIWTAFGLALHKIVNPLVMGLLFFTVITPFGLAMRVFRKDPLGLRFEPDSQSYWIFRDPPGPDGDTMPRQF